MALFKAILRCMSGTIGCFYDWVAREFERVANLLRGTTKPRDAARADELAALASALHSDCDCCCGAMAAGSNDLAHA
ncbi:MAG: hypothetical protein L6R19_04080 [Alphaproteobacteria bacterium]|nr:hypothetical protein [Alphaproteobacteria bacterium]